MRRVAAGLLTTLALITAQAAEPLPPEIIAVQVNLTNLQNAVGQLFVTNRQLAQQLIDAEAQKAELMHWLCAAQKKSC